jgi:hypothetical protein
MAELVESLYTVHVLDTDQLRATCALVVEFQCVLVWGPMAEH